MSNVKITIAGRDYTVACTAGEEARLTNLGQSIDTKLAQLPGFSAHSESQTLLFAALLLADELHELKKGDGSGAADSRAEITGTVERLAEKLEDVASRLEHGVTST